MKNLEADTKDMPILVKMFGGFRISVGEAAIQDSAMRTHQLWHLIEYLITFRHKTISQDELIEVLWPNDDIDNPANALKNLVYRIRSTFSAHNMPYAKEMIVYSRGSYQWNNDLSCTVDIETFEEFYKKASDPTKSDELRIENYMSAINLYGGDFLPGSCYESWVIPISSYYRSMYFKCVYAVMELLSARERYQEIEMICKKALIIDQFEENAHIYLMLSMVRQGKQTQALAHYSFVTDLFFRELGVNPSSAMRALYRDIVKTVHNVEIDINTIQEELREAGDKDGAFYCEYEVFKNLYRLEARTAARAGQSIFISLLTVESENPDEPIELKNQSKVMDSLYEIIQTCLRKGDVFSRFSATQYVLMLPTLTYENCEMVMGRIIKKHKQSYRPRGVVVSSRVQPLDPIDML
ncbi:MAG: winged helix-turn-helix domain-containing protein [Oscillospiraceae bacterium]|jgi:DNA-binding SARP family transcriptional activator|nr:winged helix-turn-helix domain-containing protein [Oscillospiraceae bacterium]